MKTHGTTLRQHPRFGTMIVTTCALALMVMLGGGLAGATAVEEFDAVIPLDTHITAPEGSRTDLASVPVGEAFAGQICTVTARSENQESIHPGNDLIVESGSSRVTLADVESGAGEVVTAQEEIELGSEITVALIMGPDEVFSAGLDVHIECVEGAVITTSTTLAATTTTISDEVGGTSITPPPEDPGQPPTTGPVDPGQTPTTAPDDEVLGTVITPPEEVEDVEVLPHTGGVENWLLTATGLVLVGAVTLVAGRRDDA